MVLRPSFVPLRIPLPAPLESSLLAVTDPPSNRTRVASPTVSCLVATVATDPSFESTAASALVAELVDFAVACCLDYATALVAESESACLPSVGGECALGTDVLEVRREDFECLAAAVPRFASMMLAPEGDPDAPDIPTLRSYAEAIMGNSPPSGRQPWMPRLHPRSPQAPTLDEEIWLRRPPGFTGSIPACTQWSLQWPVVGLRQAPREWHDTLRTTLAALGFTPSTADSSLFLRTETSLPPFYVLVYVYDLVFSTADTEAPTLITRDRAQRTITMTLSHMVHQVLQHFGFQFSSPQPTPLSTSHSLSTPPSDENVELSGSYPELVGCLMYLMTCIRPDLAYPLSLLARYVDPGRHQKVHWDAAKTVLRYLCSTSGMGLVLGGWGPVVLTGHADDSWELRWLTYLLIDLGEQPRSPPVLYVDNKAMIALCQEHRTKHIALRYFLARELQQRGQLRLAYVATRANTADIFNKALPPGDHQHFSTVIGLLALLFLTGLVTTCSPPLCLWGTPPEGVHPAQRADEEEAADAAAGLTAPPQPPPRTTAAAAAVRRERRRRGDICGSCGTHHPHPLSLPMTSHSPPQQQVRLGERGGRLALQVQSPPHTLPSPPHPPPQLLHVQQGEGGEGGGGGRGLQGARSAQDSRARVARRAAGRAVAATARAVAAAARAEVAAARAGAATARAVAAAARAVAAGARAVAAAAGAVAAASRAVAAAARAGAATARAVAAAARA
ncbi:unnamed protein product, partial [Closterium sp. NIES-53]